MKLKVQMLDDAGVEVFDFTLEVKDAREAARALHDVADAVLTVKKNTEKRARKLSAAAVTLALESDK
jgi:hypothetical protein